MAPLTVLACCGWGRDGQRTVSGNICMEMVPAVDDYLSRGFTLLSNFDLGLSGMACDIALNFQTHLAASSVTALSKCIEAQSSLALCSLRGGAAEESRFSCSRTASCRRYICARQFPGHCGGHTRRVVRPFHLPQLDQRGTIQRHRQGRQHLSPVFALLQSCLSTICREHHSFQANVDPSSNIDAGQLLSFAVKCDMERGEDFELVSSITSCVLFPC